VLGSCLLRRAKWKPGRRLTAYYDVRLLDLNRAGHSLHPIEVDWRLNGNHTRPDSLTDQLAPEVEAMQAEAIRLGLVAPFQRLAADLPTLGVRIQISPLDAEFPQLVRLSNPDYVRDRLAEVGALESGASSRAPDSGVFITPIRYRPASAMCCAMIAERQAPRKMGAILSSPSFIQIQMRERGALEWLCELPIGWQNVLWRDWRSASSLCGKRRNGSLSHGVRHATGAIPQPPS